MDKELTPVKREIIFLYAEVRCHALIVDKLSIEDARYIGTYEDYDIYSINKTIFFDQFMFEAIKREEA